MDARCKRIRMYAFTDVNVYVWTGPKFFDFENTENNPQKVDQIYLHKSITSMKLEKEIHFLHPFQYRTSKYPNHQENILSLSIHVESLENLINAVGSFSVFSKLKILRNSLIAV